MNYAAIIHISGQIMRLEAICLMVPCITSLVYREEAGFAYFFVAAMSLLLGQLFCRKTKDVRAKFFAREGFLMVGLCWVILSALGALPFVLCGDIPNYIDAFFETVSGFTTTGSSILTDVEALTHTSLMWRSFTHWVGGMGVFVLLLTVLPGKGGYSIHLMKAESTGASVGKLVPRIGDTAKILYTIYFTLTVIELIVLLLLKMPLFDALCTTFGTAGTGGFGIKADSMASYSHAIQYAVTFFLILFGVNFNAYFFVLGKDKLQGLRLEEVRGYLGIIAAAVLLIMIDIRHEAEVKSIADAFRLSAFQVASIITTAGFATTDFDLWPTFSKMILVLLMFIGGCAGSTAGGIKVSRIIMMVKSSALELVRYIHPRSVSSVKMDGKAVDQETITGVRVYLSTFMLIFALSLLLVALDGQNLVGTTTAVITTLNNVGPGLDFVGPAGSFAQFSGFSKLVLSFDMLAGRLELYPMLMLVMPFAWRSSR